MKQTEWLQETRKMRFLEAYGDWRKKRLTQEEAARLLGVHERTFRRYVDRYEENGTDGLLDKRLNQVSSVAMKTGQIMCYNSGQITSSLHIPLTGLIRLGTLLT